MNVKDSGPSSRTIIEARETLACVQQIAWRIDEYLNNLNDKEVKMDIWASALVKIDLFLLIILSAMNCAVTAVVVF